MYHLAHTDVAYTVRRYKRSRNIRIIVQKYGEVVVTAPKYVALRDIHAFVDQQRAWILSQREKELRNVSPDMGDTSTTHFIRHRPSARKLVEKKIVEWNEHYQYAYKTVSIRRLKSRWGSCSTQGNLTFNYKIIFLSEELQDYLIVHELCHLQEMNHSSAFWKLVARTIPDYQALRKELQNI